MATRLFRDFCPVALLEGEIRAFAAEELVTQRRISAFRPHDDAVALGTAGRLVGRWVGQLAEVVFVSAVGYVIFGIESGPAFRALRPIAGVPFGVVEAAQRVAPVVAGTTVPRVGEHLVVGFVVTDPLAAAFRSGKFRGLAAKTAAAGGFSGGFPGTCVFH